MKTIALALAFIATIGGSVAYYNHATKEEPTDKPVEVQSQSIEPAQTIESMPAEPVIHEQKNSIAPASNTPPPSINLNVPVRSGFVVENPTTGNIILWHNGFTIQF